MKKMIIVGLLAVLLLGIVSATLGELVWKQRVKTAYESDDGFDIFYTGSISGQLLNDTYYNYTDFCSNDYMLYEHTKSWQFGYGNNSLMMDKPLNIINNTNATIVLSLGSLEPVQYIYRIRVDCRDLNMTCFHGHCY
jgi:hypothetical protein